MGRPTYDSYPAFQELAEGLKEIETIVPNARKFVKRIMVHIEQNNRNKIANAKEEYRQKRYALIREAKAKGVSDYAIGRATGVTRHDLKKQLIKEAMEAGE